MAEVLYCDRCRQPVEADTCPCCGQKLHLPILPEDLCRLTSQTGVWGGILEELLNEAHIPFSRQCESGASVITGSITETWTYYVHYANLSRAAALVEDLEGDDGAFIFPDDETMDGD